MAQLNAERARLSKLSSNLPKQREEVGFLRTGQAVEYRYANYNIEQAEADYQEVSERIRSLQMEIDYANQTVQFEVEL